jgi:hypothetical protein
LKLPPGPEPPAGGYGNSVIGYQLSLLVDLVKKENDKGETKSVPKVEYKIDCFDQFE